MVTSGEEIVRDEILQRVAGVGLAACLLCSGCGKRLETAKEEKPAAPPFQRNEASLAGMVKQERSKIQNDFKNLGIYYLEYETTMGKPPAKWEEFKSYIGSSAPASLISGIEEGRYIVIWKTKLASNKVLAYEKQPDVRG